MVKQVDKGDCTILDQLAKSYTADEQVDGTPFRKKARILQSMWREHLAQEVGFVNDRPSGSMIRSEPAKNQLLNFLTDNIRKVVLDELEKNSTRAGSERKVISETRLLNNLLSSQPLTFNLFGELSLDFELTQKVLSEFLADEIVKILKFEFEHSPGRKNPSYTNDGTAFDVFIECETLRFKKFGIGIEVKYHENLADDPAKHKSEYDQIATSMCCFKEEKLEQLRRRPLEQIWRDHLLLGSMKRQRDIENGVSVVLYPKDNKACGDAIQSYSECLRDKSTFDAWTLERFVATLKSMSDAPWISAFEDRYLNFGKVDAEMERMTG